VKRHLISVVLLACFLFLLNQIPLFHQIETIIYDQKIVFSADYAPDDILLVELDQHSLDFYDNHFHLTFPWPRSLYARAIDFLQRSGARLIALDMIFSESDRYGEDEKLAFSMKNAGNVMLPFLFTKNSSGIDTSGLSRFALPDFFAFCAVKSNGSKAIVPVPEIFQAQAGGGNVMERFESGAIIRRLRHVFQAERSYFPSFSLAMARTLRSEIDPREIPFDRDGSLAVRFQRFYEKNRISICDLIQSQVRLEEGKTPIISPERFRGKIVIIGATAPGLLDIRPTPLSRSGAGLEILASSLLNILNDDFIRFVPPEVFWIGLLLVMVGLNLLLPKVSKYLIQVVISLLFLIAFILIVFFCFFYFQLDIPLIPVIGAVFLCSGYDLYTRYHRIRQERKKIKTAFETYLSDELLIQVMRNPKGLSLKGEKKLVTVFFSDLAGFTSLSERLDPTDVVALLNLYLERMTDIIKDENGWVNKFEGDAIMAIWGAPLENLEQAARAMNTAWRCCAALDELNLEFAARGLPALGMRIGVNSGEVIVGNIGSEKRMEYTVIGDAVNLASRLEGINKQYGTRIICGSASAELNGGRVPLRRLDRVRVKGKERPEDIFEVLGPMGDNHPGHRRYEEALASYFSGKFSDALEIFAALAGDPVAAIMAKRCQALSDRPPTEWDGVYTFKEK